jgi:plasmid stabilization system protein ParE
VASANRPACGSSADPILDDLTDAYAYFAEEGPGAAGRLLGEIEAAVGLFAAFPDIGRPRGELRPGGSRGKTG